MSLPQHEMKWNLTAGNEFDRGGKTVFIAMLSFNRKKPKLPLSGYTFIVIEDEMLQALRTGEMITELGGTIQDVIYNFDKAQSVIEDGGFDCAVLDVNLHGTLVFPIAAKLKLKGIPFLFVTAYGEALTVYGDSQNAPYLSKPVSTVDLRDALLKLLRK